MRLRSDGNNLRQRQKRLTVPIKLSLDLVRTDLDQMALPHKTDRAMVALHRIKQTFAFYVNLLARDCLEGGAGPDLGGHVDEAFACPFLQAPANKLDQRLLAGRKDHQGGMCRFAQMPGGSSAWTLSAGCDLVDDLLRRARIG